MRRAMIVSVGGDSTSTVRSLSSHKPAFVSFLCSQDGLDAVTLIRGEAQEAGIVFRSEVSLVDNPEDPQECLEKAREAVERVTSKGFRRPEVLVDYAGGTKNMSVALALVGTNRGYLFTQPGRRGRSDLQVHDGREGREHREGQLTWDFYEIDETKKIFVLFNQNQFKAAKDIVLGLLDRGIRAREVYRKIGLAIDGYYQWDLFRHREALDAFKRAKVDDLMVLKFQVIKGFADDTSKLVHFLEPLARDRKLSFSHVLDLYANAERRFEEGKIDDAILRLYRVVEMSAQERLANAYGINVADVRPAQIPEALREEFSRRYRDAADGRVKLPLSACYRLLDALGDGLGQEFRRHEARFRDLQSSRNYSYLAHGFGFSKEGAYISFRDFILGLGLFRHEDAPVFPKLRLP
ncbi:MAG: TIGR02710 family CRISPR-associated CARF protein [Chloroflexota bacterium]